MKEQDTHGTEFENTYDALGQFVIVGMETI